MKVRSSFTTTHRVKNETYLTRGSTENDTETILIVTGSGHVHHLYSAARKTESLQ